LITAEQYPVKVGGVALLKTNNRLVYVRSEVLGDPSAVWVTYEHEGTFKDAQIGIDELETPEARVIEEARFSKFMFDFTSQVNESAKQKGPTLVH